MVFHNRYRKEIDLQIKRTNDRLSRHYPINVQESRSNNSNMNIQTYQQVSLIYNLLQLTSLQMYYLRTERRETQKKINYLFSIFVLRETRAQFSPQHHKQHPRYSGKRFRLLVMLMRLKAPHLVWIKAVNPVRPSLQS